jgi:hypothetical protein
MMHQTNFNKPNPELQKIKYKTLALFQDGADLPLFTSCPDSVPDPFYHQPEKPKPGRASYHCLAR